MSTLSMRLVTPGGIVFEGNVISVSAPGSEGSFQVLTGHAPLTSLLKKGIVTIVEATKNRRLYDITGGFLEVSQNRLIVLADEALAL